MARAKPAVRGRCTLIDDCWSFLGEWGTVKTVNTEINHRRKKVLRAWAVNLLVDRWKELETMSFMTFMSVTFISERFWFIVQEMLFAYEELMNLISDVSFGDSFMQKLHCESWGNSQFPRYSDLWTDPFWQVGSSVSGIINTEIFCSG